MIHSLWFWLATLVTAAAAAAYLTAVFLTEWDTTGDAADAAYQAADEPIEPYDRPFDVEESGL